MNLEDGTPYDAGAISADDMAATEFDAAPADALSIDPAQVELVFNGSFELNGGLNSTVFPGWAVVGGAFAANWYADNGGGTPVSGFPQPPPPHGNWVAVSDEFGPSNMALFQDVQLPANLCRPLRFSFLEWHGNRAGNWSGNNLLVQFPNQHIRVDVLRAPSPVYDTGPFVIQNVYLSQNPDPFVRPGYVLMTATLPQSLGGQRIRLRFAQANTQFFQQVGIDRVSLIADPDVAPPVISMTVDPANLWPPNHRMVQVASGISATDDCGLASFNVSVSSDEPVDGLGDGDTAPDWVVEPGPNGFNVSVRAERSGTGDGRTYTIRAVATDLAGNTTTSTATVNVAHNR